MFEQSMAFHVGDQVIHWVYGLGEIIRMEQKVLSGHSDPYYVVQIRDLTLWVPVNDAGETSLRFTTPAKDFKRLFQLLSSPGDPLSTDRYMRKTQLTDMMKDRSLESICRVVRDLMAFKKNSKLNDNDNSILDRAKTFLLAEWSLALSVPIQQAERELMDLVDGV